MRERNLFYVAPQFYPNPTGFGVAFTNLIKFIVRKKYFTSIYVITTEHNAKIPEELNSICKLKIVKVSGSKYISHLPLFMAKILSIYIMRNLIKFIKNINVEKDDVFFYEEFVMGHFKYALEKKFPNNKHIIRVHGTFPEFTAHYKDLKQRKILFDLAVSADRTSIATTTNFYIDYLNKYYFKESYDLIQNINYYILPNALIDIKPSVIIPKNDTKLKLFQLGRMDKVGAFQKGFIDTVKALQYIESIYPDISKKIYFELVGDGEESKVIEKELEKLKIIQFNYSKSKTNTEVLSLLETSDVILMPSRCEGMSMFATESLYKGKPIIFTSNNGLRDYLYDNINGFNITEYDYTELANAIIKYYNQPEKIEEHSENNLISAKNITSKTLACLDVLFKG